MSSQKIEAKRRKLPVDWSYVATSPDYVLTKKAGESDEDALKRMGLNGS